MRPGLCCRPSCPRAPCLLRGIGNCSTAWGAQQCVIAWVTLGTEFPAQPCLSVFRRSRLFWQRLVTPGGTPYWWSSLLGRACMDVPEQPWGGWCCEEMGLGEWRAARVPGRAGNSFAMWALMLHHGGTWSTLPVTAARHARLHCPLFLSQGLWACASVPCTQLALRPPFAAGKTIEVLGLILANPAPPLPPGVHKDAKGLIKSRATLVVGGREGRRFACACLAVGCREGGPACACLQ